MTKFHGILFYSNSLCWHITQNNGIQVKCIKSRPALEPYSSHPRFIFPHFSELIDILKALWKKSQMSQKNGCFTHSICRALCYRTVTSPKTTSQCMCCCCCCYCCTRYCIHDSEHEQVEKCCLHGRTEYRFLHTYIVYIHIETYCHVQTI